MDAVLEVNENTKKRMVRKISEAFGDLESQTVAVLGLSFKPDTDDIRESPALEIISGLLGQRSPSASVSIRQPWTSVVPSGRR